MVPSSDEVQAHGVAGDDAASLADTRRRDALELNDSIVQGLTVIQYALELGDLELAQRKTEETLAAARRVITDLLTRDHGIRGLKPGSMVRRTPATTDKEGVA